MAGWRDSSIGYNQRHLRSCENPEQRCGMCERRLRTQHRCRVGKGILPLSDSLSMTLHRQVKGRQLFHSFRSALHQNILTQTTNWTWNQCFHYKDGDGDEESKDSAEAKRHETLRCDAAALLPHAVVTSMAEVEKFHDRERFDLRASKPKSQGSHNSTLRPIFPSLPACCFLHLEYPFLYFDHERSTCQEGQGWQVPSHS